MYYFLHKEENYNTQGKGCQKYFFRKTKSRTGKVKYRQPSHCTVSLCAFHTLYDCLAKYKRIAQSEIWSAQIWAAQKRLDTNLFVSTFTCFTFLVRIFVQKIQSYCYKSYIYFLYSVCLLLKYAQFFMTKSVIVQIQYKRFSKTKDLLNKTYMYVLMTLTNLVPILGRCQGES